MSEFLDMRKAPWNQAQHNIYKARTKAIAQQFARKHGWSTTKHIMPACNWLETWWVIAQCIGGEMTFLRRDGTTVTLPYPGFV